jgi:hypothetical protein
MAAKAMYTMWCGEKQSRSSPRDTTSGQRGLHYIRLTRRVNVGNPQKTCSKVSEVHRLLIDQQLPPNGAAQTLTLPEATG